MLIPLVPVTIPVVVPEVIPENKLLIIGRIRIVHHGKYR